MTRPWTGAGADEALLKGSREPTTSDTGPKLGLVIEDLRAAGASQLTNPEALQLTTPTGFYGRGA